MRCPASVIIHGWNEAETILAQVRADRYNAGSHRLR